MKPRKWSPEETLFQVKQVAYFTNLQKSEKEIAGLLNLSEATVSRRLEAATHSGFIQIQSLLNLTVDDVKAIEDARIPEKLLTYLQAAQVRLSVVANLKGQDRESRRRQFASGAAPFIASILSNIDSTAGVAWGYTLGAIVQCLSEAMHSPVRQRRPITFVPLSGDPFGHPSANWTSSDLAAQFAKVISGDSQHAKSLAGVPALLPQSFDEDELLVLRRFVASSKMYQSIFQGDFPLVDQLEVILTSVGSPTTAYGFYNDALLEMAAISREELSKQIMGDIGGVVLPRFPTDDLNQLRMMWTGLKEEHLKNCRNRAIQSGASGVVVATYGADKANVLLECIDRGLVNQIFADHEAVVEMNELVRQRHASPGRSASGTLSKTVSRRT